MGFGSSLKKAAKKMTGGKLGSIAKTAAIMGSPTNSALFGLSDFSKRVSGHSDSGGGYNQMGGMPQISPQQMQWQNDMNGIFANMASAYGVDPMMYQRQMQQIPQIPMNALMQQQPQQPQQPSVSNMLLQAPPAFTHMPGQAQRPMGFNRFRTPTFRHMGF